MSYTKTRGISLVRRIRVFEPKRKETVLEQRQFNVRVNAAVPFNHKNFQNQFLFEEDQEPKPVQKPKKPKQQQERNKKLNKWKRELS